MEKIVVIVPIRLVSESNKSEHWAISGKRHRAQKMAITAFLRHQLEEVPLPCEIKLVRHSVRFYDDDNLRGAFKYVRDAVSEFAIPEKSVDKNGRHMSGRADSDDRIRWSYAQEKCKEDYITIEITPTQLKEKLCLEKIALK